MRRLKICSVVLLPALKPIGPSNHSVKSTTKTIKHLGWQMRLIVTVSTVVKEQRHADSVREHECNENIYISESSSPSSWTQSVSCLRGRRRHTQNLTRIFLNLLRVRAQSHATERSLAVERPQATRVERIRPVLFCEACGCVAANHSSDISKRGLRTKWRTSRSSSIKKWRDELTCIKSQKSSRICTSMHNSI